MSNHCRKFVIFPSRYPSSAVTHHSSPASLLTYTMWASLLELQTRLEMKNVELGKLKTKENNLRRDCKERVEELEDELRQVVEEKKQLEDKLFTKLAEEKNALKQVKISFDADMAKLTEEKSNLLQQQLEKRKHYGEKENALRDVALQLSSEIDKLSSRHATSQMLHLAKIDALKVTLTAEIARRQELEQRFARIDRNHEQKRLEEEKLRLVAEKEDEAMSILHAGATQMQKLWRGKQARVAYDKMKKKKGKKGKKSKKGEKK